MANPTQNSIAVLTKFCIQWSFYLTTQIYDIQFIVLRSHTSIIDIGNMHMSSHHYSASPNTGRWSEVPEWPKIGRRYSQRQI